MRVNDIARIVRLSGVVLALFVGLSLPTTFAVVSFKDLSTGLVGKAQLSAGRAARYIFANERMWQYQRVRLQEIIELPIADYTEVKQSIVSSSGVEVYADAHDIQQPNLTRSAPIVVGGQEVGTVQVTTSLRPMIVETVVVATLSVSVAILALLIVHVWPLRLIRRTLSELEFEQQRTKTALDQLKMSEDALLARSTQLEEAQKLGHIGDWGFEIGSSDFFISPVAAGLLRLDATKQRMTMASINDRLIADSGEKLERTIADAIRSRSSKSCDVTFRRGDGTTAFLTVAVRPILQSDGRVAEMAGTIQDISERREAEAELERLAYFDGLTGLANRALFKRELSEALERTHNSDHVAALLMIDLDRFKEVNDSLGHGAGDELLCTVARMLTMILKNRHFVARLGGDEFAIIINEPIDRERVEDVATEILAELDKTITLGLGEVRIGGSIGIAMLPKDARCAEDAIKNADLALYRAKDQGRGRFTFFEPVMSDLIQEKMALARDLRAAAADGKELEVWFQPQVNLARGQIVGFEALMRWKHPVRGYVSPSEFIPIAESSSLIMDIGIWIMRESARTAKAWLDEGHPPYEVSVNLSAAQIWQTNVEEDIAAVLKETGLPARLLCVELTESLLVDHSDGRVRRALARLKSLGVKLALDDFGTGYSSLGYLTQLPFDKLKIDRVFVAGAAHSKKMQHVLKGIVALGHGLGMTVVAEGVEHGDDLDVLRQLGCDQVQGYIFARPAPAERAIAFARGFAEQDRYVA